MAKSKSSTQPDVEKGMSTPKKGKNVYKDVSPAKTEPMSPAAPKITVQQRSAPRGLFGMTRNRTLMILGLYLVLIGVLVYFIMEWLDFPSLNDQVDRLKGEVNRLEKENNRYENLNDQLNETTQYLNDTAYQLNASVDELNQSLIDLGDELENLKQVNANLEATRDFLNETAGDIGQSYNQITTFLADKISANRALMLARKKNSMQGSVANFECNYGDRFSSTDFGMNFALEIPSSTWFEVSNYVSERVMEENCLDDADFVKYFQDKFSFWSTINLFEAVTGYTNAAFAWYFPDPGETGLTYDDWATANFDCQQLTTKYLMY
eukprot:scaffold582_cov73-Cylindrotheca_fusiformis.AAC.4